MVIKFFSIAAVVFLISLFLCNITLKILQSFLLKKKYEFTDNLRYFFSSLIMLLLGITVGKIIIGKFI